MSLRRFQSDFAAALRAPVPAGAEAPAWARQPGFAVYRNTVRKACTEALLANYPAVTRLVGEAWMHGAASLYLEAHPPADARLLYYGVDFPRFLAGFAPAADLPYLPAVARLDRCWTESHLAADAPVLPPGALAALSPEALGATPLVPHPAARWTWCADHPARTIWSRSRSQAQEDEELAWQGEGALLTRPAGAVAWQPLPRAGHAFLQACSQGLPLGTAAAQALEVQPDADLAALMAALLQAGAFTGTATTP